MSRPSWGGLTRHVEHRPWPLPSGPWVMTMSWVDLAFIHWGVDAAVLRPLVPPGLELETFDGRAWLGVVPFRMEHVGPRGLGWLPGRLPGPRDFPELNVRTYVRHGDYAGVFFLSLDATSWLAVEAARRFFHLPYFRADITCRQHDGWTDYRSTRRDPRLGPGELRARYRPLGGALPRHEVSDFETFLTERYCLYAEDRAQRLWRGHIHHLPWPLQRAELEIETNTLIDAHGLGPLAEPPVVAHYAERINVVAWGLEAV